MKDGRLTVYFGGPDRKTMEKVINRSVKTDLRFRKSEAEFVRHCIRYALEHDKSLAHEKKSA